MILGEMPRGGKAELDLQELITGRTLLCSVTGGGKSWTARRIVEQIFGRTGIIIVDVEGEYATLRERYPFLIVGKDLQLVPEAAEFLADQILHHELSAILDGSDPNLDVAAFQEFLARFIDRFIALETTSRKPYLWILEEADELAPETGIGRSVCLDAIRKLVKKGRKRGLGVMVLTQRPAFVSKFVISQCTNKLVGRTEWPDDIAVLHKFARIPDTATRSLGELSKGEFYTAGDFIAKDSIVKVGAVATKHSGATPELVPPAPRELETVVAQLSEKLPGIIQEQLLPAVPKVAEMEARLKEKFEAQWKARLARKDKELTSIRSRLEAKYEVEIADLKRKLDDAVRHATMKGGVSDLLSHPLVQKNLEKLSPKQRALVQLLETKGAQDAEHCSLFLECKPRSVPDFMSEINRRIPKLIERTHTGYASRLAKLFPVTEEAQAEAKEVESLRNGIAHLQEQYNHMELRASELLGENERLIPKVKDLERQLEISRKASSVSTELPTKPPTQLPTDFSGPEIAVEATLRRTLTKFTVATNTEILDVDESTVTGKLLATGLRGFFSEGRGFGAIMNELERKYSMSRTSGGSRDATRQSLEELVAKDILDRRSENNQWIYTATDHFNERVRKP